MKRQSLFISNRRIYVVTQDRPYNNFALFFLLNEKPPRCKVTRGVIPVFPKRIKCARSSSVHVSWIVATVVETHDPVTGRNAWHETAFLPPANEVWGKVIFSQASVILLTGGGVCLSACWDTPPLPGRPPCQGDPPPSKEIPQGNPLPRRPPPGPHPGGKLRGIRSRLTAKGEIDGDQIQAHTQGGNWGGSDPGPHPKGKLRGIRSRPTPKGEIQVDQDQTPPPPHDDYCCGRCASYWNAFLFKLHYQNTPFPI